MPTSAGFTDPAIQENTSIDVLKYKRMRFTSLRTDLSVGMSLEDNDPNKSFESKNTIDLRGFPSTVVITSFKITVYSTASEAASISAPGVDLAGRRKG